MAEVLITCNTIKDEVCAAITNTGFKSPVIWIESGLHNNPDKLRLRLQEELDKIHDVNTVLLGFGFCGNSVVGLKTNNFRLIIPKADDCITIVLGSRQRRKEVSEESGTYFLTEGWLRNENNIWDEYKYTLKKYGKRKTSDVYKMLLQHYKRLGIIDTGAYDINCFMQKATEAANDLKLRPERLDGTLNFLEKLLTGPWDNDFLILDPHNTLEYRHVFCEGYSAVLQ